MKKIVAFLLICLVVCSSAFAFVEVSDLFGKSSSVEEELTRAYTTKPTETSTNLNALSEKVLEVVGSKSKQEKILEAVDTVREDVKALEKEAYGAKFLINGGFTLGFDGDFIIGAIAQFGVRLGHGLMLQLGAEYDFFKTAKFEGETPEGIFKVGEGWGVYTTINGYNNLKANITFGWEF